ncbi:MAG TPA: hypothetical protein VM755_15120 [Stellaceae bacterium]|nr:hypothetical protein [Stellaceae bacterium]
MTETDLCRIKGAIAVRIVIERMEYEYRLTGYGEFRAKQAPTARPINGKADLFLDTADREPAEDLTKRERAVALVVSNGSAVIYWIEDGRCTGFERCATGGRFARAQVEARYPPT